MKKFKYLAMAAAAVPFVAFSNVAGAQDLVVGAAGNPGGLAVFVAQEKGFLPRTASTSKLRSATPARNCPRG